MLFFYSLTFQFSVKQKDKKKKYEPPIPTRVGKKKKKTKGPDAASKLPLGMQKRKTKKQTMLFFLVCNNTNNYCALGVTYLQAY